MRNITVVSYKDTKHIYVQLLDNYNNEIKFQCVDLASANSLADAIEELAMGASCITEHPREYLTGIRKGQKIAATKINRAIERIAH